MERHGRVSNKVGQIVDESRRVSNKMGQIVDGSRHPKIMARYEEAAAALG